MSSQAPSRFLQFHTLTSYPAALLNRDDAGFAKRMPFGTASRLRVSSQCLKRHWRRSDAEAALSKIPLDGSQVPMSVRSRLTFERQVYRPLVEGGASTENALAVTGALIDALLGKSKARTVKSKDIDPEELLETGQVTVLGRPEVEFLLKTARETLAEHDDPKAITKAVMSFFKKEAKKNLAELRLGMGLDAAVFGRMVTGDALARSDAAIHVAHAFTVHGAQVEPDYFSAVDDLRQEEGELGSGHINNTELTSGLYYGYVVIDLPLLVSNITGADPKDWSTEANEVSAEVVRRLVHLIATTSPGAKLGSTAPYSYAHLMMIEAGSAPPRTLANAFLKPVAAERGGSDLVADSYDALGKWVEDLDRAYGSAWDRRALVLGGTEKLTSGIGGPNHLLALPDLANWAARHVGGQVAG